jgi:putative FmdB family regulatory protein
MPIYEYRCAECGFQDEYLQKISEPPLTVCPSCGKPKFAKMISAAGFQLKGSGWYATDFKGGARPAKDKAEPKPEAKSDAKAETKAETKAESKSESKPESKAEAKTATAPASSAD